MGAPSPHGCRDTRPDTSLLAPGHLISWFWLIETTHEPGWLGWLWARSSKEFHPFPSCPVPSHAVPSHPLRLVLTADDRGDTASLQPPDIIQSLLLLNLCPVPNHETPSASASLGRFASPSCHQLRQVSHRENIKFQATKGHITLSPCCQAPGIAHLSFQLKAAMNPQVYLHQLPQTGSIPACPSHAGAHPGQAAPMAECSSPALSKVGIHWLLVEMKTGKGRGRGPSFSPSLLPLYRWEMVINLTGCGSSRDGV